MTEDEPNVVAAGASELSASTGKLDELSECVSASERWNHGRRGWWGRSWYAWIAAGATTLAVGLVLASSGWPSWIQGLLVGLAAVGLLSVNLLFILATPRRRVIDYRATVSFAGTKAEAARLSEASARAVLGSIAVAKNGRLFVLARTGWETRMSLTHQVEMSIGSSDNNTTVQIVSVAAVGRGRDAETVDDVIKRRRDVERLLSWWHDQPGYVGCSPGLEACES